MGNYERKRYFAIQTDTRLWHHPCANNPIEKNSNVNTNTLDMLCEILDCQLIEVAEHIPNTEKRLSAYFDRLASMHKNDKPQ